MSAESTTKRRPRVKSTSHIHFYGSHRTSGLYSSFGILKTRKPRLSLALSMEANRVDVSIPFKIKPCGRTMDKVQKPSDSKWYTPQSESITMYKPLQLQQDSSNGR
jgi:hypothetical protein